MKKLYTEVLIPRVKNWGSENRWEKLGPQDVKNTPRSPGKDRCVIEANRKISGPPKSDRYFPRYFRYFFSSLVNEFFLDSAAPSSV
jgi:hypothetical protein